MAFPNGEGEPVFRPNEQQTESLVNAAIVLCETIERLKRAIAEVSQTDRALCHEIPETRRWEFLLPKISHYSRLAR